MVIGFLQLLLFVSLHHAEDVVRENVSICLVYQNYAPSKVYDKAFKEAIRNINSGKSISQIRRIASKYELHPVTCVMPKGMFYPSHVLDCICNTIIKFRVVLIVFVTASEYFDESTLAAEYFLHMASQTGIPIIAWNADSSGFAFQKDPSAYRILQLAPPIEHQIQAMFALLKRYNWSKFGIISSRIAGADVFYQYVQTEIERNNEKSNTKMEIVRDEEIDDDDDLEQVTKQLSEFKKSEARIILLYSTTNYARKIFQAANKVGMTSDNYLWIGTQSVKGSVIGNAHMQAGMLSINFHTVSNAMFPPDDDVLPLIIGLAPKVFGLALNKLMRAGNLFPLISNSSCDQPSSAKWPDGAVIYRKMKEVVMKGNPYHSKDGHDSFFYSFDHCGKLANSYLTISNLRRKKNRDFRGDNLIWEKVGEFTNGELKMIDIEWPGDRAKPPQGTPENFHARVVTLQEPPFIIVSQLDPETGSCPGNQGSICNWDVEIYEDKGVTRNKTVKKCCSGFCIDLLQKLAKDIGFTYTIYKVPDNKWGRKTEKGWNGLMHELVSGKADMCVTALKLNSERAKDIDFSIPFMDTGISIIVKIRSGVLSPTAFLEPFEYSTWVIILLVSIQGAALAIFIFEWLSPSSFNMSKYPPPGHKFSLCRSYWLVWATLFSASVTTDVPRSLVSRFMSLVWAAFGLTFLAVYTANLAAFMITRVRYYEFEGVNDAKLAYPEDQTPYLRYGVVEDGNTHETMRRNWFRMNDYIEKNNFFRHNITEGIESVRNEELHAFIYDAVVLDYLAGKDPQCELITVGRWSSMTGYGIAFPKNSPHVQKVNSLLLQYQQKGDLERLHNFWMTGSCERDLHKESNSSPLGIENFMSAFVLLIAGLIVSIAAIGIEYFYCSQLRKPLQKIDPNGWCGLLSMSMGKSLTFREAVDRVKEWNRSVQNQSPSKFNTQRPQKNELEAIPAMSGSTEAKLPKSEVPILTHETCV